MWLFSGKMINLFIIFKRKGGPFLKWIFYDYEKNLTIGEKTRLLSHVTIKEVLNIHENPWGFKTPWTFWILKKKKVLPVDGTKIAYDIFEPVIKNKVLFRVPIAKKGQSTKKIMFRHNFKHQNLNVYNIYA